MCVFDTQPCGFVCLTRCRVGSATPVVAAALSPRVLGAAQGEENRDQIQTLLFSATLPSCEDSTDTCTPIYT
jgi:hypothetical protein